MASNDWSKKTEELLTGAPGTQISFNDIRKSLGDPNASIPTPQPVYTRPMFSSFGRSLEASSITFVSKDSIKTGSLDSLNLAKETIGVEKTRDISKEDMVFNNYCPDISVDPETYEVTADGNILTCEPATELPLAQRYFLF